MTPPLHTLANQLKEYPSQDELTDIPLDQHRKSSSGSSRRSSKSCRCLVGVVLSVLIVTIALTFVIQLVVITWKRNEVGTLRRHVPSTWRPPTEYDTGHMETIFPPFNDKSKGDKDEQSNDEDDDNNKLHGDNSCLASGFCSSSSDCCDNVCAKVPGLSKPWCVQIVDKQNTHQQMLVILEKLLQEGKIKKTIHSMSQLDTKKQIEEDIAGLEKEEDNLKSTVIFLSNKLYIVRNKLADTLKDQQRGINVDKGKKDQNGTDIDRGHQKNVTNHGHNGIKDINHEAGNRNHFHQHKDQKQENDKSKENYQKNKKEPNHENIAEKNKQNGAISPRIPDKDSLSDMMQKILKPNLPMNKT